MTSVRVLQLTDGDHDGHYELVVAHPLPVIDLSVSVLAALAGPSVDTTFFAFMRRHYGIFVVFFRAGSLLMLAIFLTPAAVGHVLVILTVAFTASSLCFSVLMMSWQLLLHAITMQEIMFMSTMNWLNWVAMAELIHDTRLLVCIVLACSFQLSILSDVMFRTVLSASKTALLALPLLVVCVLAVFFRAVDVNKANYASIRISNVKIEVVDVVLNMSITLSLLVARNIYRQRRALASTENRLITCTMLKTKLMLRPMQPPNQTTNAASPSGRDSVSSFAAPSSIQLQTQTPVKAVCPPLPTDPHLQQLRLVPTSLKLIDSRVTLVPGLTPTHPWSNVKIVTFRATGLTGLVLMVLASISLDKPRVMPHHIQRMVGVVSFVLSTLFIATSVVAMQRRLLRVLSRHFDVLMNVFQLLTGALCLCAMVQWDQRCLVAVTISLWFVWIVLFDALTPRVRQRMGLSKRHAGVALVGVMTSLICVVVSLTFAEHNAYADSEITSFRVRAGVAVEMRTKSFFLNRMFPLTVWAVRLLWELLHCAESELVFVKGSLEYYCPLDMLPMSKPRKVNPQG